MSQNATGPRTPEGKQRSSVNARKHGFTGRAFIVAEEEQAEFTAFIDDWENELMPLGAVEAELFGQVLNAAWTLHRLSNAEADLIGASMSRNADPLTSDDAAVQNKLRLYSTYKSRAERSFHKSLAELRKVQEERLFRDVILAEDHGLPALPRSGVLRREILRDKRTHAKQQKAEMEAFILSPPPGRTHPKPPLTPGKIG